MEWLEQIKSLRLPPLKIGAHVEPEYGLCAMEMVAFMEREEHSDQPKCVCPVLRQICIYINDETNPLGRRRLRTLLAQVIDTNGDGLIEARRDILRKTKSIQKHIKTEEEEVVRKQINNRPEIWVYDIDIRVAWMCLRKMLALKTPITQFNHPERAEELVTVTVGRGVSA